MVQKIFQIIFIIFLSATSSFAVGGANLKNRVRVTDGTTTAVDVQEITVPSGGFTKQSNRAITLSYAPLSSGTLTSNRIVSTDGTGDLTTVSDLTSWISGTSDRIDVTDGGSGDVDVDISSTYVGQTSITTLGTIGTGTWEGTAIADDYVVNDLTLNTTKQITSTLTTEQMRLAYDATRYATFTVNSDARLTINPKYTQLAGNSRDGGENTPGVLHIACSDSFDPYMSFGVVAGSLASTAQFGASGYGSFGSQFFWHTKASNGSGVNAMSLNGDGALVINGSITTPGINIGASSPFVDSAGTLTLRNVDAIDATTESTLEAALDLSGDVTGTLGSTVVGDDSHAHTSSTITLASTDLSDTADLIYDADFSSTGIMTRTSANNYEGRTLTGTSNRLSISNGDGVSGNPTFDIDSSYVGQATITTLGTIGAGTWQGTSIADAYIDNDITLNTTKKIVATLTSEQMRLEYNSTKYTAFSVNSTGKITISHAGHPSYVEIIGNNRDGGGNTPGVIDIRCSDSNDPYISFRPIASTESSTAQFGSRGFGGFGSTFFWDLKDGNGGAVAAMSLNGNGALVVNSTVSTPGIVIGSSTPFSDSSGTLTLQNVDVIDATTETTLEAALDLTGDVTGTLDETVISSDALEVTSLRSVSAGLGALATTATDGFLYIPTCAGTPTGTPTAISGYVPMVYDTTNNVLYVYDGAWQSH